MANWKILKEFAAECVADNTDKPYCLKKASIKRGTRQ